MEEWKKINEYRNYEISTHGRIRRTYKNKVVKILKFKVIANRNTIIIQDNYYRRFHRVGKLVAETFIDNPLGCKYVKHLGDNLNDHVDNIVWIVRRDYIKKNKPTKQYLKELISEGYNHSDKWMNSLERKALKEITVD